MDILHPPFASHQRSPYRGNGHISRLCIPPKDWMRRRHIRLCAPENPLLASCQAEFGTFQGDFIGGVVGSRNRGPRGHVEMRRVRPLGIFDL